MECCFYLLNKWHNWRKRTDEKNEQNALVYLLGGVGVIVSLGGVSGIYNIFYGLISAFVLWIIAGAIGKVVIGILGSVGFIFIFVGIFHFSWAYVLLGTIAIWVIVGTLRRYYLDNDWYLDEW